MSFCLNLSLSLSFFLCLSLYFFLYLPIFHYLYLSFGLSSFETVLEVRSLFISFPLYVSLS